MIIVSKKRILAIMGMVLIAVCVFSFQVANTEKTVETVALPVTNKVIVLDARSWRTR